MRGDPGSAVYIRFREGARPVVRQLVGPRLRLGGQTCRRLLFRRARESPLTGGNFVLRRKSSIPQDGRANRRCGPTCGRATGRAPSLDSVYTTPPWSPCRKLLASALKERDHRLPGLQNLLQQCPHIGVVRDVHVCKQTKGINPL